jgi:hypothetical protein
MRSQSPELESLLQQVADEVIREALRSYVRTLLDRQNRAFKLWQRLTVCMQERVKNRAQGSFGILAQSDPLALEYQYLEALRFRIGRRFDCETVSGGIHSSINRKRFLSVKRKLATKGRQRIQGTLYFSQSMGEPSRLSNCLTLKTLKGNANE